MESLKPLIETKRLAATIIIVVICKFILSIGLVSNILIFDHTLNGMQLLVFILVYPILRFISILPFPLFYGFSNIVYFFIYRVFGYRKKVVAKNLSLSFPEKSVKERKTIEKKFYKHMCDLFLEMIKTMGISKKQLEKRYVFTNLELMQQFEGKRPVLLLGGHIANFEWMFSLNNYVKAPAFGVYQILGNKYFDRLVRNLRAKYNTTLLPTKVAIDTFVKNEEAGLNAIYGILSDQSPQPFRAKYWSHFMGIKVPVFTGAEMLATKLDMVVLYLNIVKTKRGHYEVTFVPITTNGADTKQYEITETYLKLIEEQIRVAPEHYLWTHRRFKHRDKVPVEFQ